MVGERADLDHGRDDRPADDNEPIEGDGFVMTDAEGGASGADAGGDAGEEQVNPEASTYGAP